VKAISDKWKAIIIWLSFLSLNVILAILVGKSSDETLFERTQFAWMGCVFMFLGIFGLRFKGVFFLKGFAFSYDNASDLKSKICFTVNIIGLIIGISLLFYGIYYNMTYTV